MGLAAVEVVICCSKLVIFCCWKQEINLSWNKRDLLRAVSSAGLMVPAAGLSRVALPTIGGLAGAAGLELLFQREAMAADAKLSALATGTVPDYYYGIESSVSKKYNVMKILNVVDFGADPTHTNDSSPGIQAAMDAAFGTVGSPHGDTNKFLNKAVYIPNGNYKCLSTIVMPDVHGGWVFGGGALSTRLSYEGTVTGGATVTSLLKATNLTNSRIENLNLAIGGDNTIALNLDGGTGNTLVDILVEGTGPGVTSGINIGITGVMGSEYTFIRTTMTICGNGMITANSNALNITILGGSASECAIGYNVNLGSIGCIIGGSFAANTTCDIKNNNACSMHVIGGRTESANYVNNVNSWMSVSGVQQNGPINTTGKFVETGSGCTVIEGCRSDFGVLAGGGNVVVNGCAFSRLDYLDAVTGIAIINNSNCGSGNNTQLVITSQKKSGGILRTYGTEAAALTDASFLYCGTGTQDFTCTSASPAVLTANSVHQLVPNYPLVFTTTNTLPTGLSLNTVYYVKDIPGYPGTFSSATTFTISLTPGGAAVNTSSTGTGTHTYHIPALYAVGDQILKTNVVAGGSPGWSVITAGYSVAIVAAGVKAQAAVAA